MSCPDYSRTTISNGNITCDGNSLNDDCNITCNSGYYLTGQPIIKCRSDGNDTDGFGEWGSTLPICEGNRGIKKPFTTIKVKPLFLKRRPSCNLYHDPLVLTLNHPSSLEAYNDH